MEAGASWQCVAKLELGNEAYGGKNVNWKMKDTKNILKILLILAKNERVALVNLKRELEKTLNLVDYRVFGSKARGEESPESDIDVMIEVENYTPEVEALIDELVFEINLDHDCLISTVIFGSKELHEGPLRESPIYRSISREGVRI